MITTLPPRLIVPRRELLIPQRRPLLPRFRRPLMATRRTRWFRPSRIPLYRAAGDVLLDADGNVILDDAGNVMLSDGAGDDCCCGHSHEPCGSCNHQDYLITFDGIVLCTCSGQTSVGGDPDQSFIVSCVSDDLWVYEESPIVTGSLWAETYSTGDCTGAPVRTANKIRVTLQRFFTTHFIVTFQFNDDSGTIATIFNTVNTEASCDIEAFVFNNSATSCIGSSGYDGTATVTAL